MGVKYIFQTYKKQKKNSKIVNIVMLRLIFILLNVDGIMCCVIRVDICRDGDEDVRVYFVVFRALFENR